jgi:SAM-dependent methyltransferase
MKRATRIGRQASAAVARAGRSILATRTQSDACGEVAPTSGSWDASTYERLYDKHAQAMPTEQSIGSGDFEHMGEIMLSALCDAGLRPEHTLVDLGCGTGRLSVPAVSYLSVGRYVGIDISQTMLGQARHRVASTVASGCDVSWQHQTDAVFECKAESVDFFAAFSVFTHMEHEDTYRYLTDARRVVRDGGRFVFSCLTMDLEAAREVFLTSSDLPIDRRWASVRNVTTTYEFMDSIAALAGWRVLRWYKGNEEAIPLRQSDRFAALGQSVCVLGT